MADSVEYGRKWSHCTLWLHLAFYSEAEKIREKLSKDRRSTGEDLPNGKDKNVCWACFCLCFCWFSYV